MPSRALVTSINQNITTTTREGSLPDSALRAACQTGMNQGVGVLGTVRDSCKIHPVVHDYRMTEAIENLSDLITDQGNGSDFFARNHITQGMDALFREGLLRLAGLSNQAAFELAQAMGGGKTHLMVALGLLAKHPDLRPIVLSADLAWRLNFGPARIAAFKGRNDPEHFIWGEDGTNPKEGPAYTEPFTVPAKGGTLLIAAKAGEVEKSARFQIPADGDDRVIIDDHQPARLVKAKVTLDTTDRAFALIQRFKDRQDTLLRGVQILIGAGETAVQIRFNDRALTVAAIEMAIAGIRQALGDPQAEVQVLIRGGVSFGDGYALKEFAEVVGIALTPGDVIQGEA
jgi:hypothetical protein